MTRTDAPGSTPPGPRGFAGNLVACRTSEDYWIVKYAITDAVDGRDFVVVWVRWPDDSEDARTPWPVEDVVLASEKPAALTHAEYLEWRDGR